MTRKPTTFRIDPEVQVGLALISELEHRTQNQLVNEALREFVARRAQHLSAELAGTLERLRAYRQRDPDGRRSMAAAMAAEAAVVEDPAQGKRAGPVTPAGPLSARMLKELGG
jgi:predicted transcriptional regulator